ncbi:protein ripply1 [Silurus meridionalis]|nr:protein ripply1 [Silurus meridionalis]
MDPETHPCAPLLSRPALLTTPPRAHTTPLASTPRPLCGSALYKLRVRGLQLHSFLCALYLLLLRVLFVLSSFWTTDRMESACLVVSKMNFPGAPSLRAAPADPRMEQSPISRRPVLWRPWLMSDQDSHTVSRRTKLICPYSRPTVPSNTMADGKALPFQHPVRLFWPKSKSYDYLYRDGEALLKNFPVQATICFYDESDSEEDDDEEQDEWDDEEDDEDKEYLKPQGRFCQYN